MNISIKYYGLIVSNMLIIRLLNDLAEKKLVIIDENGR